MKKKKKRRKPNKQEALTIATLIINLIIAVIGLIKELK